MANYLQFENVFGESVNREIYRLAQNKREHFTHSRTSPSRYYPDWRKSTVIYDNRLREFAARVETAIRHHLDEAIDPLGIPRFQISGLEIQLTSHNDGEYYHWHTDNGSRQTRSRTLTFVYYFHREPKGFSGGELVIYDPKGGTSCIAPQNDRLVLFDSGLKHEVRPVVCPSGLFEDGRFTLNGWVRRKERSERDYFDFKIFSFPARRTRAADTRPQPPLEPRSATRNSWESQPRTNAAPESSAASGAQAASLLELYSNLFRQSPESRSIDVRRELSGDDFYRQYYFPNRPVLLKEAMRHSSAVREWTPDFFKAHHGSVPIQITDARSGDPDYEVNFEQTVRATTLGRFVDRLHSERTSNDYYLVARNYFFQHPALAPLRHCLNPPPDIVDTHDQRPGTTKLWFGPKGTLTPLHHDEHSILFAQIYGRKQFKLIPPFDSPYLYVRRRFYSAVDPERVDTARYPAFLRATTIDVWIEPGDILFLPVAWWHWARSLDVSISATFSSFRVPGHNTVLRSPRDIDPPR